MRCHEARRRITAGDIDAAGLAEHLQICAACARIVLAEQRLKSSLNLASGQAESAATPLPVLRQRIERLAAKHTRKEIPIMSNILNQVRLHPGWSTSLALAVVLFLFVSLVPFSYERVAGYDATVALAIPPGQIPQTSLQDALAMVGQSSAKLTEEAQAGKTVYHVTGLDSKLAAREMVAVINSLAGVKGEATVTPVMEMVSSSLLAQARDKAIRIEVDGKGKSDAELEQEINSRLLAAGITNPQVTVSTGADGYRQISVSGDVPADGSEPGKLELQVKTGAQDSTNLLLLEADSTLSDADLRTAIESQLAKQGVTNPNIEISRDVNGKRKVEVRAEKHK